MAALDNSGAVARSLIAWKEAGRFRLEHPWSLALAHVISTVISTVVTARAAPGALPPDPVHLVPVPTDPAHVRERGADPMRDLTRRTAHLLRRAGLDTRCRPILARRRATRDQAGLSAEERRSNVAGAFECRPRVPRRQPRQATSLTVVVDDIITTGASADEAVRALRHAGIEVAGIAVVAATPGPRLFSR